ncbi:MAG: CAP domain-containing protein [Chitinophagaceae bacterium]
MKARFLLSSFTCFTLFISLTSFSPHTHSNIVDDVLSQTNQFRKSNRLPALTINTELNAIAQKHSADMANGRVGFGHGGFSKRNQMARNAIQSLNRFAENVAYGATSGKEVVTDWKNSPGHRRNMLGRYKYIGIGIARDRRGRIYYTQVFAG